MFSNEDIIRKFQSKDLIIVRRVRKEKDQIKFWNYVSCQNTNFNNTNFTEYKF